MSGFLTAAAASTAQHSTARHGGGSATDERTNHRFDVVEEVTGLSDRWLFGEREEGG